MHSTRLALIVLVALGLAPGLYVRELRGKPDSHSPALLTPLRHSAAQAGPLTLAGAWHLTSPNETFGGYSAMVPLGDDRLLAVSDTSRRLLITRPDRKAGVPAPVIPLNGSANRKKTSLDVESLTRDPATGRLWAGYEVTNALVRYSPDFVVEKRVRPAAMRGWGENSGPETLVRLTDGRFLVIEEEGQDWSDANHTGLLFPGDPTDGAEPIRFTFAGLDGYKPVDAAQLPDGRVVILMRRLIYGLPPRFASALMIADPAAIKAGGIWQASLLAKLEDPIPSDNFEGLAITSEPDGSPALWLISDDNFMTLQRTLLLKFVWRQHEKARG